LGDIFSLKSLKTRGDIMNPISPTTKTGEKMEINEA
jgi:hypothetical protein